MSANRFRGVVLVVVACLAGVVLAPAPAAAQSGIAGVVKDSSGAVLPGVTVEASSPALIERARTAVTDDQGQYKIIDLRPGTYAVTFSLAGFRTVRREGINLPANFTAPVNATLDVGTLQETVTVSGASPVVDVQNATVQTVMERQVLDALPTGRSFQAVAQTAPGVVLDRSDMAGTEAFFSTMLHVHGSLNRDQAIHVDGMDTSDLEGDGRWQGWYRDDGDNEEIVYGTTALPAEVSRGGVRINMIGREGGNQFKGTFFVGETPGGLQSQNITPALRASGLPTAPEIRRVYDYNFSGGGPVKPDRMWFFGSFRMWAYNKWAAGAVMPDGSRATDDAEHATASLRLTTQLTQRNKLMVYFNRMLRRTLHNRFIAPNVSPEATTKQTTPTVYAAQAKWTLPLTNKLLFEAGFSTSFTHIYFSLRPEVANDPTKIPHVDLVTGSQWVARSGGTGIGRHIGRNYVGSLSYVTGSHAFKAGIQYGEGQSRSYTPMEGPQLRPVTQEYRNGLPSSVTVYAVPRDQPMRLNPNLGLYAQDLWTIKRLTLNYGIRFEYFRGKLQEISLPAGRFVPARHLDEIDNLPNWKDWTPRLGVVYDLFGDAKTALKASVSEYTWADSTSFTRDHSPALGASDRRTWTDLNGDDVAQDNEIGPPNVLNLGLVRTRRPAPGIKRPYNIHYAVSLQRELLPQTSVTVSYFRRQYYRMFKSTNLLAGLQDYTPVTITSPLNGEPITIYNLNPQKRGLVDILTENSDRDTRKYNGFEVSFNARRGAGALFGGLTVGKTVNVTCDVPDPNLLRFCDQTRYNPYLALFKLSGMYSLPLGIQVSGVWQSSPGEPIIPQTSTTERLEGGRRVDLVVTRALVPTLTQPSITVALIPPGSKYFDRFNQVDVRVGRRFRMGRMSLDGNLDIFNLLNTNVVMRETETWGPALERPLEIPQGRLFRFTVQAKF